MEKLRILIMGRLRFEEKHRQQVLQLVPDADVRIVVTPDEAGDFLSEADIVVGSNWDFNRDVFMKAKNLKWMHAVSAGIEHILFGEMIDSSVMLSNARGIFDMPAMEHTIAVMLTFSRGLFDFVKLQKQKVWGKPKVMDLNGATLGIIGLGSIGRELARAAKVGFGMRVIGTKKNVEAVLYVDEVRAADKLDTLMQESDFVVIAAAATIETEGLIGLKELKLMKPGAYIINIARGSIINEKDLIRALKEGWIAGAALDVFEKEPLPADSELYELNNVLITGHRAGFTHHNLNDERINNFCDNLEDYIAKRPLRTLVNKHAGY